MTEEETIRRELWALVKKHGSQYALCKAVGLKSQGYLNHILSGKIEPSDRFCQLVGWRRVVKYEKIISSTSAEASDKSPAAAVQIC